MKKTLMVFGLVIPVIFAMGILDLFHQGEDGGSEISFSTSASAFNTQNSTTPDFQEPCYRGDANSNGEITIADVVYLINYLFKDGEPPVPLANGDVDCVKGVTITDAVYLVNYLFRNGEEPCIPPEIFEISVTSPHQANGTDSAEVTIIFTDSCGNDARPPDFPAESFFDVYLCIGEDPGEWQPITFPVIDNLDGTYTSYVISTSSGEGVITVEIVSLELVSLTPVVFTPGPVEELTIVNVEQPRDEIPRHTGRIVAVAVDSFQNIVNPADVNIIFETDFGEVDSITLDESGDFIGWISSWIPGDGMVTVTEEFSGLSQAVEITFPAYHLFPPVRTYIEGDTLTGQWEVLTGYLDVGLNIWNPKELALGFYDLVISFDSSIVRFLAAEDWDTTDAMPGPIVQILDSSNVRIWQAGVGGNSNDIARLIFEPVTTGEYTHVTVNLLNNDPSSLSDVAGFPIYSLEEWWLYSELEFYELGETEKPWKPVEVKVWVAPGVKAQDMSDQIFAAFEILRLHVEKCCPRIYPNVVYNYLSDSTWDSLTGENDSLDRRSEYDSVASRCNKPGSIDIIGTPDDCLPGATGRGKEGVAVLVDAGASSAGTTMAHELGHYWGLGHKAPDSSYWGKANIMYRYTNAQKGKKKCAGLTVEQCEKITESVDP